MFKFIKTKTKLFLKDKKSIYDTWATTKNAQGLMTFLDKLPNPDPILRKSGKGISALREVKRNYQVKTCIKSRKAGVLSSRYRLLQNDCPNEQFEFYSNVFNQKLLYKLIENILETPLFGYCPIEISYELQNGLIVPTDVNAKPQEWFYFDSDNNLFFKDKNCGGKREIDLKDGFKFLCPTSDADYINPYGEALLSSCFWNVAFINGGMEFWIKFTEKYGMPYTFGKYDRSMTKEEKQNLFEALVNMVSDAVAVIPNDGSVEIMNPGSNTNTDIYERIITKCENNISKVILGQTLTTDIGNSGSYAAANAHMGVREDIINSDKTLVENTINDLISKINQLNFKSEIVPIFEYITEEDLGEKIAQRDNLVKNLGVKFSKNYIQKTYGYQEDDVEMVETSEKPYSDFSEEEKEEDNVSEVLAEAATSEVEKIIDFFAKSKDTEAALEKLEELYPKLSMDKLEEILAKVIYIAELKGRLDVQNGR